MTDVAPPGWYADPSNPAFEHWWDGTAYSQTRPVAHPVGAPVLYAPRPLVRVDVFGRQISPKSRTIAALLGFFLGGIGIHRFYLGNVGMAVAMLLLGWLTLGIWPLIDWIVVLAGAAHDGQGLPVVAWE